MNSSNLALCCAILALNNTTRTSNNVTIEQLLLAIGISLIITGIVLLIIHITIK